jgi:hypothetical protein
VTLALLLWAIVGPSGRRRSPAGLAVVAAKPPSKLQAHTRLFPGAGQRLLFRLRRLSGDAKAIGWAATRNVRSVGTPTGPVADNETTRLQLLFSRRRAPAARPPSREATGTTGGRCGRAGGKRSAMTVDLLCPAKGAIFASAAAVMALRDLLIEKGIITSDDFVEALDRHRAYVIEQLRQRRVEESDSTPRRSRRRPPGRSRTTP